MITIVFWGFFGFFWSLIFIMLIKGIFKIQIKLGFWSSYYIEDRKLKIRCYVKRASIIGFVFYLLNVEKKIPGPDLV